MFKNQKFFMSLFCVVGLGFAQVAWAPEGDDETDLDLDPDWDLVDSSRDGIGAKSMSVKTAANAPEENDDWNLVDPWQARVNSEYFSRDTAPERKAELAKIAQNEVEKAQLRDANFKNYLASGLANPVQVSAFSGTDSMIFSKDPVEQDPDADWDLDIQSNAEAKQIAKKAGQMAEEAQQRSSIKDEQDSDATQIQKKMQAGHRKVKASEILNNIESLVKEGHINTAYNKFMQSFPDKTQEIWYEDKEAINNLENQEYSNKSVQEWMKTIPQDALKDTETFIEYTLRTRPNFFLKYLEFGDALSKISVMNRIFEAVQFARSLQESLKTSVTPVAPKST